MYRMDFMSNFVNIFCHWVRNLRPLKENVIDRIVIYIVNDTILAMLLILIIGCYV